MRMRKKPNLVPRMQNCGELLIADPASARGSWHNLTSGKLLLEIGCGKGRFTADLAAARPEDLVIAVERVESAMVIAMERARDRGLNNVRFIDADAAKLGEMFAPGEIDTILLNFSDPWPKSRDAKFRLTAPGFLRSYADVLPVGGELCFKTDNTPLFDWSCAQMENEGWQLRDVTHDLHANGPVGILTDYEAKFMAQGMKINRLCAVRQPSTLTTSAGAPARLRNASLTDARGYERSVSDHAAAEA